MPTLAIYLDAPLQAWGASSKYQYRETNHFPTKSALIGLLAAAVGVDKHDPDEAEHIAPLNALRLIVAKIPQAKIQSGRLSDFHTIGGGFNKDAGLREKLSIPRKASGAPFGTVITRRAYLTDARFIALFQGPEKVLSPLKDALLNPVFGVWLGRKTCIPASPLTPTLAESPNEALANLLELLPDFEAANHPLESLERQEEAEPGSSHDGQFFQSDQPVAFGQHQGPVPAPYKSRAVIHHRPIL